MPSRFIKAEILFTRRCNLRCPGCSMVRNDTPELDSSGWRLVIDRLNALGVGFFAIYGAEPTLEFHKLCDFVRHTTDLGIACTVISNATNLTPESLRELKVSGLDSITLSLNTPKATTLRDRCTLSLLRSGILESLFKDVEVSFTVSKDNYLDFLEYLESPLGKRFWTSFDLLHHDRGNPRTKCSGPAPDLSFLPELKKKLLELKRSGVSKIHQSEASIEMLRESLDWICRPDPSFLTVDCDGTLMACDDCSMPVRHNLTSPSFDIEAFVLDRAHAVRSVCRGCCWTTHFMSDEMVDAPAGLSYFKHQVQGGES